MKKSVALFLVILSLISSLSIGTAEETLIPKAYLPVDESGIIPFKFIDKVSVIFESHLIGDEKAPEEIIIESHDVISKVEDYIISPSGKLYVSLKDVYEALQAVNFLYQTLGHVD